MIIASHEWFPELVAITMSLERNIFPSKLVPHIIEYRSICRATSSCSFSYTYRVTVSPSTLSRGSSIRAEARLPEISICAGVVTVCLIWHGAAYVRNKSSRVQCRCPCRKPIVYADLTRVVYSSRLRERYLILATRFAAYVLVIYFCSDQLEQKISSFSLARKNIIHLYSRLQF